MSYLRRKSSGEEEVLLDLNDAAASSASLGQVLILLQKKQALGILVEYCPPSQRALRVLCGDPFTKLVLRVLLYWRR